MQYEIQLIFTHHGTPPMGNFCSGLRFCQDCIKVWVFYFPILLSTFPFIDVRPSLQCEGSDDSAPCPSQMFNLDNSPAYLIPSWLLQRPKIETVYAVLKSVAIFFFFFTTTSSEKVETQGAQSSNHPHLGCQVKTPGKLPTSSLPAQYH